MERRQFFSGTISALLFSVLKPVTLKSNIKEKPWIVGIGTVGSKIAKAVYDALPYYVHYHAIDSNNSNDFDGKKHITCWFKTKIIDRPLDFGRINENDLADDWNHNMSRYYVQKNIGTISGNIIIVAGLGGKTGSYVSFRLIQHLLKNKKNKIQFIGTKPYDFEGKNHQYMCDKYFNLIQDMGVKAELFSCWESTKDKNMSLSAAFKYMDRLIVKSVIEKVKIINI